MDTQRLAHYYSQLSEHGLVTQAKHTSRSGGNETSELNAGPRFLGGSLKQGKSSEESVELQVDPALRRPQETLDALFSAGYLHKGLSAVGKLCLLEGLLTVIDLRLMKELWPYVGNMLAKQQTDGITSTKVKKQKIAEIKSDFAPLSEILQRLPHSIQGSIQDTEGQSSWYTLKPEFLTVNPEDLVFKCGCDIPGIWKVVCIVDAYPDLAYKADHSEFFANDLEVAMRQMMGGMQSAFGRPSNRWGITPILIFRKVEKTSPAADNSNNEPQENTTVVESTS